MPGPVPGIHAFDASKAVKTWMATELAPARVLAIKCPSRASPTLVTSPAMTKNNFLFPSLFPY
jgi:hypothetical protein